MAKDGTDEWLVGGRMVERDRNTVNQQLLEDHAVPDHPYPGSLSLKHDGNCVRFAGEMVVIVLDSPGAVPCLTWSMSSVERLLYGLRIIVGVVDNGYPQNLRVIHGTDRLRAKERAP
jgi:hypothetical protein